MKRMATPLSQAMVRSSAESSQPEKFVTSKYKLKLWQNHQIDHMLELNLEGLSNPQTKDLIKKIETEGSSKRQRSVLNLAYDRTRLSGEWPHTPISIEFELSKANQSVAND